ncbi:AAA family ATPase [Nitrobacter sp. JJSN]|uniref:AAA family ATPase n=1 Tax=Nitrobacter sp. JJSN TaxID=3453033 RepID=UPI003F77402A
MIAGHPAVRASEESFPDESHPLGELAALATRGAKDQVPVGEILEQRWRYELGEIDVDPWKAAHHFVPIHEIDKIVDNEIDPPEIKGTGPVAVAASKLFRHQSVIGRKELLHSALVEASFLAVGIDQVWAELHSYEARGILRRLAGKERTECWTTASIAAAEARLLRAADRSDEHDWFRADALETALANAPHLAEEQAHAVRFSANRDGVAICEAPAGTGKTILTRALVEAAHRSGLKVLGLTPTWVAADELSKSCDIDALAIAKWRYDYVRGQSFTVDANTLIVIDEIASPGLLRRAASASCCRHTARRGPPACFHPTD